MPWATDNWKSPQRASFLFSPEPVVTYPVMSPNPLTHTSARVLEFEWLRDLLRGYASSPLGQTRLGSLVSSSERDWIERQQELTSEIREFRRVGGRFEFAGLVEIDKLVEKA